MVIAEDLATGKRLNPSKTESDAFQAQIYSVSVPLWTSRYGTPASRRSIR